jgi:hypothetical protein
LFLSHGHVRFQSTGFSPNGALRRSGSPQSPPN